jgi:hypothetical protein
METVGALASGIAHNFNNIVGAILGHTEIAEVQLASHNRLARSLKEIRRAGERARDLIDQILAFGSRLWVIPAEKMKGWREHVVPLPMALQEVYVEALFGGIRDTNDQRIFRVWTRR